MEYLIFFAVVAVIVANYFYIRMFWIKHFSMIVLQRSPIMFLNLPPFKTMVWKKFWIWNEVKFLPNVSDLRRE